MDEIKCRNLVVADICNTLYDSNTTFDFIAYCIRTRKITKRVFIYHCAIRKISPFFWFLAVLQRLTGRDFHKSLAVSLLRNQTVDDVNSWADEFYKSFLISRTIQQTTDILRQFDPGEVMLASSTIEPVARTIAAQLGISRFVSTGLEVHQAKYTGRILNELGGNKLEAIRKQLKETDLKIDVVLTDNISDRELMFVSLKNYAICYNRQQEIFWKDIPGVEIINISNQ